MRPVGLVDPRSGERPHAVVQLRQEDKRGLLYNLVGFQTKMRLGEQKRVFRSLPGLGEAVFARYGSVHRNTYVNAPKRLERLEVATRPGLFVAGQMAGVEGYVESAALGGLAGLAVAFRARAEEPPWPAATTAHGALLHHLEQADPRGFQPMNASFGLFPPLERMGRREGKRQRHQRLSSRALQDLDPFARRIQETRSA
jgi:methylenetetrahydrofolate--tRNA-(uracil-5-)-methyltransferase